jgi:hypothetical protein
LQGIGIYRSESSCKKGCGKSDRTHLEQNRYFGSFDTTSHQFYTFESNL